MLNYSQGKQVYKAPIRMRIQMPMNFSGARTEKGKSRTIKTQEPTSFQFGTENKVGGEGGI